MILKFTYNYINSNIMQSIYVKYGLNEKNVLNLNNNNRIGLAN
jgi:hypothetical protein